MSRSSNASDRLARQWDALHAGEPKAVHETRKLTRRVQAEVRVADAPKRTKRAWRDLRRAVAPVRDRDAVGEHLTEALRELGAAPHEIDAFQTAWRARRDELQSQVRLPDRPPAYDLPKSWKKRAREALDSDRQELLREARQVLASDDIDEWHEWRKHLKRYRHTLELVGDVPDVLTDVLSALGRLQDAQVTRELLESEDWLPEYRERILAREHAAQHAAQQRVKELAPQLERQLLQSS